MSVALVTGATGLVGSHIVERLLGMGWMVRALTRSPVHAATQLPAGVETFAGDVLDEGSFTRAAAGSHVVFHAAANIIVRGGWEAYRVTNVEGTRIAIAAAERARARLLHVSSVAVYGTAHAVAPARSEKTHEDTPLAPLPERAFYARSKRESEELVFAAHRQGRVWATAVRPDVIYGRRDRQFVPRIARLVRYGAIPEINGGRSTMPVVHARNVAQGAVLAATSDIAGGKAWNLANDFAVSVRRFFELAAQGLGTRPLWIPLPEWLARAALRAVKSTARFVTGGQFNLVSSAAVDFLAKDNPFSSDRAKRELGWRPEVQPEIGIPDAFRYWLESPQPARHR